MALIIENTSVLGQRISSMLLWQKKKSICSISRTKMTCFWLLSLHQSIKERFFFLSFSFLYFFFVDKYIRGRFLRAPRSRSLSILSSRPCLKSTIGEKYFLVSLLRGNIGLNKTPYPWELVFLEQRIEKENR